MEILESILSQEIVQRIGWTLVHFIWQGALVAMLAAVVLKLLKKASSNLRYVVACIALAVIVIMPVTTFQMIKVDEPIAAMDSRLRGNDNSEPAFNNTKEEMVLPVAENNPRQVAALPAIPLKERFVNAVEPILPYAVLGWLIGVAALSVWYLGGWTQLQRLRRRMVKQVSGDIKIKLKHLLQTFGISKAVEIVESAIVNVPTVIGYFKPMILLPATAVTGLSGEQIEAILAHELAHIKRCDYLVNILQTVVEILGFYHPAVWWISNRIRAERENCCDDIAVRLTGDNINYAQALATMEEVRMKATEFTESTEDINNKKLVIAASGGNLFNRICRLLGKDSASECKAGLSTRLKVDWLPSIAAIVLIALLVIPVSFAVTDKQSGKTDLEPNEIRVYEVNKNVADFSDNDFSTPESSYAAINKISGLNDNQKWAKVSVKRLAENFLKAQSNNTVPDAEWIKVLQNTQILEVRIWKNKYAMVMAKLPQEFSTKTIKSPIDLRSMELEDGKWLNCGNNRVRTMEEARAMFAESCEYYGKKKEQNTVQKEKLQEALNNPEIIRKQAQELFEKLKNADCNDGKRPNINYQVSTDWRSWASWVCKTFKDNPIVSIDLGKVSINKNNLPSIEYKLTLKDGSIIEGNLPFEYQFDRDGTGRWQALEGVDWHLQNEPIKKAVAKIIASNENFNVLDVNFEPIRQGKNILWLTVQNKSDKEQFISVNVYSRSVDYGKDGVGWGTSFRDRFDAWQTRKIRYVYKIHGPITDNTYTRLCFYNVKSLIRDENKDIKPFAEKQFSIKDLKVYPANNVQVPAASQEQFDTVSKIFVEIQGYIRSGEYEKAWEMFSSDYQKAEYQTRELEGFKLQMEPKHILDSAFLWEKKDFLKLKPTNAYMNDDKVVLAASIDNSQWKIDFVQQDGKWKIDWIGGYTPKIIEMQEKEAK